MTFDPDKIRLAKAIKINSLYDTKVPFKKAEGSRHGEVIGHTKSGKPIYQSHGTPSEAYGKFTKQDHLDAAELHHGKARKAAIAASTMATGSTKAHANEQSKKHSQAHQWHQGEADNFVDKAEGSHGGQVIGHTKSGNPIYSNANHPEHKDFTKQDHHDAINVHNNIIKEHEHRYNLADNEERSSKTGQKDLDRLKRIKDHHETEKSRNKVSVQHHEVKAGQKTIAEGKNNSLKNLDKLSDVELSKLANHFGDTKNQMSDEERHKHITSIGEESKRRSGLKKSDESEILTEDQLVIENNLLILKGIDVSKLQKKEVQIKGKNGKTFFAIRYVNPNTGVAENTGHTPKDVPAENKTTTDSHQIEAIVNHPSKGNAEKLRDLMSMGIYDKGALVNLVGCDYGQAYGAIKKLDLENMSSGKTSKRNEGGGENESDDGFPPDGMDDMNKKEINVLLEKQRMKRREELGLTYKDFWGTYRNTLEDVVVTGYPKSMIAYGSGGVGKTYELHEVLKKNKVRMYDAEIDPAQDQYDAVSITGDSGKKNFWQTICKNKDKIVIFDDCDSMWTTNDEGIRNILKGMLDTTGDGIITYGQVGKDENGEQLPKTIKFTGQVIFISNLERKEFPQPLINSRCAAINLTMTKDETMEKLGDISPKIKLKTAKGEEINVSSNAKSIAYKFFQDHKNDLSIEQINGRTFAQIAHIAERYKDNKDTKAFEKEAKIRMNLV